MIARSNYEIYLIDLLDGKLEEEKKHELMTFLSNNPDLKEEFEGVEEVMLAPSKIKFAGKDSLKKFEVNENNIDQFLTPEIENKKFSETILTPDHSIVFENKESLKKRDRKPLYYYISAAASVLIIFLLGMYLNNDEELQISSVQRKEINPELFPDKKKLPVNPDNKMNEKIPSSPLKVKSKNSTLLTYQKEKNNSSLNVKEDSVSKEQIQTAYIPQIEKKQDAITPDEADSPENFLAQNSMQAKIELVNISDKNNEEILIPKNCDTKIKKTKVDLLAGVVKFTNKLINKKVKIKKEYDCDGNLVQYAFSGNNFGFSKKRSN